MPSDGYDTNRNHPLCAFDENVCDEPHRRIAGYNLCRHHFEQMMAEQPADLWEWLP